MADAEVTIQADPGWLDRSPLFDLVSGLAAGMINTPDVYTKESNTTGSDYVVVAVIGVIMTVLFLALVTIGFKGRASK